MSAVQGRMATARPDGRPEPWGEWILPGKGEPAPGCGTWAPTGFCEGGHVKFGARQYGRRECPDCWSARWAGPATAGAVTRLAAYRHSVDGAAKRTIHAVVSPPPDDTPITVEGVYNYRKKAYEIAKAHGIIGGVCIPHPFRVTDETEAAYAASGSSKKIWRWVRENETLWREQVYWSPHYHIIGPVDPESRDPETGRRGHVEPGDDRPDGWVFRNLRSLERYYGPGDVDGTRDMVSCVRYLLSHTGFPVDENRQSITWFGALSGRSFDPEAAVTLSAYRRIVADAERLTGAEVDGDQEGAEEPEECDVDGCEAAVVDVWAWPEWRRQREPDWSDETINRVDAAYRWATGSAKPPPDMPAPRSREQAVETLGAIVGRFDGGDHCSVCGRHDCRGHLGRSAR